MSIVPGTMHFVWRSEFEKWTKKHYLVTLVIYRQHHNKTLVKARKRDVVQPTRVTLSN